MARSVNYALKFTPALALAISWQLLIWARPDYEFFLGAPVGILREALTLCRTGVLPRDIGVTASEAILGFFAGSACGTACGLAFWYSRTVHEIARPYVFALGS